MAHLRSRAGHRAVILAADKQRLDDGRNGARPTVGTLKNLAFSLRLKLLFDVIRQQSAKVVFQKAGRIGRRYRKGGIPAPVRITNCRYKRIHQQLIDKWRQTLF